MDKCSIGFSDNVATWLNEKIGQSVVYILMVEPTDSQPPPPDPMDSAAEFSHTHFSRDDDLISLKVESHRWDPSTNQVLLVLDN